MGHLIPEGLKEIRRKHERGKKGEERRGEGKRLCERRKRKLKRQEWNFERERERGSAVTHFFQGNSRWMNYALTGPAVVVPYDMC